MGMQFKNKIAVKTLYEKKREDYAIVDGFRLLKKIRYSSMFAKGRFSKHGIIKR